MEEKKPTKSHFLKEIEGLRAILALWVVMSHIMWGSGFTSRTATGWWTVPFAGGAAVQVFICISGFVIFLLLSQKKQNYLNYITKRFFRLYPLFFVTTLLGAILFFLHLGIYGVNYHGPGVFVRGAEYYQHKVALILSNILMFQGFLPKLGPIVFNPPSWSISLEWQFYLVAPIFFYLFKKSWIKSSLIILGFIILKEQLHAEPILNQHGATLADQIVPFLIGMTSFQFYKEIADGNLHNNEWLHVLKGITLLIVIYASIPMIVVLSHGGGMNMPWTMSYGIWIWVLLTILDRISNNKTHSISLTSRMLNCELLQWLGKRSYSLYLVHQLIIFVFLLIFGDFVIRIGIYKSLFLEVCILVPIIIIVANYTYSLIEVPGIEFGRKLTSKYFRK